MVVGEAAWKFWGVINNVDRSSFQLVNFLFWFALGLVSLAFFALYVRVDWKCWPAIPAGFVGCVSVFFLFSAASKGNLGPHFLQNELSVIVPCVLATSVTSIWLDRVRFSAPKPAE
jgi:hypothetical protein